MKRYLIILFLISAIAVSAKAQNAEATDSVANQSSAIYKSNTSAGDINKKNIKGRKRPKKNAEQESMTATDNSQKLLLEADSLSRLYREYNHQKVMFLPIVFFEYKDIDERSINADSARLTPKTDSFKLDFDKEWLDQAMWDSWFENYHIYQIIVNKPWLVPYNIADMPEPPKKYEIKPDPKKNILVINEFKVTLPKKAPTKKIKTYNWIQQFDASLQFSQAYLSENWYQGGKNNLNMIANAVYNLKLNQAKFPNKLFELTAQYKLGINSAPDDTLRNYSVTEDLFQINAKFGLQATKKFYYSTTFQFRTQLLQNFNTNTYDLAASFLTPGELNAGIGMTYSTSNNNKFAFDASLSPLSYNMKICRAIHKMDPTSYGIDPGKKIGHEIGSSGECKVTWTPHPSVSISSRLFVFSNYSYLQGDLETTLSFSINKFLSTQIYAHLRYDDSAPINLSWRYWQFKETLSFGLQYQFRM